MKKQTNKALEALKLFVKKCATQGEAADKLHISEQYLSDLLREKRSISDLVAKTLGYKKTTIYEEIQ